MTSGPLDPGVATVRARTGHLGRWGRAGAGRHRGRPAGRGAGGRAVTGGTRRRAAGRTEGRLEPDVRRAARSGALAARGGAGAAAAHSESPAGRLHNAKLSCLNDNNPPEAGQLKQPDYAAARRGVIETGPAAAAGGLGNWAGVQGSTSSKAATKEKGARHSRQQQHRLFRKGPSLKVQGTFSAETLRGCRFSRRQRRLLSCPAFLPPPPPPTRPTTRPRAPPAACLPPPSVSWFPPGAWRCGFL